MAGDSEVIERVKRDVGLCDKFRSSLMVVGAVFALLGVIGDAANVTLILGSITWLLLAVAFFIASIMPSINWAMAVYLISKEADDKKKR